MCVWLVIGSPLFSKATLFAKGSSLISHCKDTTSAPHPPKRVNKLFTFSAAPQAKPLEHLPPLESPRTPSPPSPS